VKCENTYWTLDAEGDDDGLRGGMW